MATWLRDDSDLTVQTGINSTQIGTNLTISGNEIDVSSGDLLIDVAGEINLDTVDGKVKLKKNGSSAVYASLESNLGELRIKSGASYATCLTLAGNDLKVQGNLTVGSIAAGDGSSENFVVEQSGLLLKRTAAEVRSDLGISDAEIIDWTADQGSTNIHADNYGNINASVVVASGLTTSAGLKLSNNIIYASDGDAAITLDTNSNVTIAGDLTVTGNRITFGNAEYINNETDEAIFLTAHPADDRMLLALQSGNAGKDSGILFYEGATIRWSIQQDASDNSDYSLIWDFQTTTAGDATKMDLDSSGNLWIDGDLTINGGNITNAITFDAGITDAGTIAAGTWSGTALVAGKVPDHDDLNGFVANEHIDWTGASAGTIHATNYTNTTYTVGDGGLTEKNFTTALNTKLTGIATGAEVNVQSDWNSSSGDDQILNKPSIPVDLTSDGAGTVHANNYTNTTYSVMASGNSYAAGLVAAGSGTHGSEFLRKDGTWASPPSPITGTANGDDNRVATYSGIAALNGEANLTFDGTTLDLTGAFKVGKTAYFDDAENTNHSSGTLTMDWTRGNKQSVSLTGTGYTCNFTNPSGPCNLVLLITQGDGSDTITTWDSDILWAGGVVPSLSAGSGDVDILSFYFDGTKYFGTALYNFS